MKKFKLFLLTLLTLILSICAIFTRNPFIKKNIPVTEDELRIHCIDVGQGDCTLIQSENINILIDGGDEDCSNHIIEYLTNQNVSAIDIMIATHPHSDHIGSLDKIIENFTVKKIYMNDISYDSVSYFSLMNTIDTYNVEVIHPKEKEELVFEDGLSLTFFNSSNKTYESGLNATSLVTLFTFNEVSYLSGGDLDFEGYEHFISSNNDIDVDILHAFHHGSSIETNTTLLKEKTTPDLVIISCGYENEYGHPHQETLELFEDCTIYRTDLENDIVIQIQKSGTIVVS